MEQRTNNNIKDLVAATDLDADSGLVLINAMQFKGNCVHPFPENAIRNERFHLNELGGIDVPIMKLTKVLRYADLPNLDASALELPYENSDLSMLTVLPKRRTGLPQLEKKLRSTTLDKITEQLHNIEVDVKLPKFKSELQVELTEAFKQLSMTLLFSNRANFSRMLKNSEVWDLRMSKIIHKAFIEVNELGTEAAAATTMQ